MHDPNVLSVRIRKALMRERLGIRKYVRELKSLLLVDPRNKWAIGQVRYGQERIAQITDALDTASSYAILMRRIERLDAPRDR